jgi:hypothetical protein
MYLSSIFGRNTIKLTPKRNAKPVAPVYDGVSPREKRMIPAAPAAAERSHGC